MNYQKCVIFLFLCYLPAVFCQYSNNATDNVAFNIDLPSTSGNDFQVGFAEGNFTIDSNAQNNVARARDNNFIDDNENANAGNDIGVSEIIGSEFRVTNNAESNFAYGILSALSGNLFTSRDIDNDGGTPSEGTIQQNAEGNRADNFFGSVMAGNEVTIDRVSGSEVAIYNSAEDNYASTVDGNGTSGNVINLGQVDDYGEYYDSYGDNDIILVNSANENLARAAFGSAISGNANNIGRISGAGTEIVNNATNNYARMNGVNSNQVAISGNSNQVGYAELGYNGEADIDLTNNAEGNFAEAVNTLAVAGNDNRVIGSFFSQGSTRGTARDNYAYAQFDKGDAIAGNRNYFVRTKTTDSIYTAAENNTAIANKGLAVSGNDNTISDVFFGTDEVETIANDNNAVTKSGQNTGDAVSGNRNNFTTLSGVDIISSDAQNNSAVSTGQGSSISGNQLTTDSGYAYIVDLNAANNTAIANNGSDSISGNKINSGANLDTIYSNAQDNYAFISGESSNSVSGNQVDIGGGYDYYGSYSYGDSNSIYLNAFNNKAVGEDGANAVSGNQLNSTTSVDTISGEAQDNNAISSGDSGEAISGNQLNIGDNYYGYYYGDSSSIDLDASDNRAVGQDGADAVSGNQVSSSTNLGGATVDLDASGNVAVSEGGADAISGNSVYLSSIGGR